MKAKVYITLKNGVLDTQGKAVTGALESLQFKGISNLRVGKYMEVEVDSTDKEEVKKTVEDMCEKLLANVIMEDYRVEVDR